MPLSVLWRDSSVSSTSLSMPSKTPKVASTRQSIAKHFELGRAAARGNTNPISLHSVEAEVFALVWLWIAETLVAETKLRRSTKEAISELISQFNSCPLCEKAHRIMLTAARQTELECDLKLKKWRPGREWYKARYYPQNEENEGKEVPLEDRVHQQALDYADRLLVLRKEMDSSSSKRDRSLPSSPLPIIKEHGVDEDDDSGQYPDLSEEAKAEVAMLLALFTHLNMVSNTLLSEQLSTAFFQVPDSAASLLESKRVIMTWMSKAMAKSVAPGFRKPRRPGEISAALLLSGKSSSASDSTASDKDDDYDDDHNTGSAVQKELPTNLQEAGEHSTRALTRVVAWIEAFEQRSIQDGLMSEALLKVLDEKTIVTPPGELRSHRLVYWVTVTVRKQIQDACPNEDDVSLAMVLLLASHTPKSVLHSFHWNKLVDAKGEETSKLLVIWWSLRWTIGKAQRLDCAFRGTIE